MNRKLFNYLLYFALFGIALGFFGILYEGLVYGPKMVGDSNTRMLFWKDFYSVISPVIYYIPVNPLATITLVVLYFNTHPEQPALRSKLGYAALFQAASLLITFYIVKGIDLKTAFSNIALYADAIPAKTVLFNILSVIRICASACALNAVFRACLINVKHQ
jgi:hypothetical protein